MTAPHPAPTYKLFKAERVRINKEKILSLVLRLEDENGLANLVNFYGDYCVARTTENERHQLLQQATNGFAIPLYRKLGQILDINLDLDHNDPLPSVEKLELLVDSQGEAVSQAHFSYTPNRLIFQNATRNQANVEYRAASLAARFFLEGLGFQTRGVYDEMLNGYRLVNEKIIARVVTDPQASPEIVEQVRRYVLQHGPTEQVYLSSYFTDREKLSLSMQFPEVIKASSLPLLRSALGADSGLYRSIRKAAIDYFGTLRKLNYNLKDEAPHVDELLHPISPKAKRITESGSDWALFAIRYLSDAFHARNPDAIEARGRAFLGERNILSLTEKSA